MSKTILVTGAAGFIGSHVAEMLLNRGDVVVGIDNLDDYYDPARKIANIEQVRRSASDASRFAFVKGDIRDKNWIARLFSDYRFDVVVHLAAMAGVRASVANPALYYDVNLSGTLALLEAVTGRLEGTLTRDHLPLFVFASTSSVYGTTQQIPFIESDPCGTPLAPYPASKRAAELLGHAYHHLYHLDFTALRFFTVYGPRGRPDMMLYKVVDNIYFGREVPLYSNGKMRRDWTYIEDIVRGVVAAVDRRLGFEVINLGRGEPVLLTDFVRVIEELTGRKANLVAAPMPDADVVETFADITKARQLLGYNPTCSLRDGISRFLQWYEKAVLPTP